LLDLKSYLLPLFSTTATSSVMPLMQDLGRY